MEVTRIIFYFFCRGYGVDDVVRECKGIVGDGYGELMKRRGWGTYAPRRKKQTLADSARNRTK